MPLANIAKLVSELEQNLLAISSLNDMCQSFLSEVSHTPADLTPCAHLLDYLIEPAMYRIEEIRVKLAQLAESESAQ